MLDTATKRRIDTARDILVGKVPDPKSQVEQITIALIYKFMDDIDAASEEMGGQRTFFAGDFARYGWPQLVRAGLGGHETLNLYAEAITRMPENPGIPPLFRDIFNNAYLPYRDPETLRAFLKVIDEFTYDHSERLGDAFEYLLSVLGSQGDAGQFRTPRHIIDFIVSVIDPKKDETILDPACGTAGFLISSYKHILKSNIDDEGNSTLTPDEKGTLAANFEGYDISPDMVRLSLVNLYLHGFVEPHISEYDTLTSEERWNEYADVILANPPFMSPKGGIRPHRRFSVQSKRSEVLFVDYMAEHLTPTGRAGIIVPEGIVFQSQTAYKQLRKMLVENYLVAVISLPAGVFQPYSGVKTSILLLDKALAQKTDRVAFFKVENDGFGLGAQRREIAENDLPQVREELGEYLGRLRAGSDGVAEPGVEYTTTLGLIAEKERIAAGGEYGLSGERYRENERSEHSFPLVSLGDSELFCIESGGTPKSRVEEYWDGGVPWATLVDLPPTELVAEIRTTQRTISEIGLAKSSAKLIPENSVIVSTRATIGRIGINRIPLATNQGFKNIIIKNPSRARPEYIALAMTKLVPTMNAWASGGTFKEISKSKFCELQIPLPPLEVQREIVAEIEGYQRVIDGERMVIEQMEAKIQAAIGRIWGEEKNKEDDRNKELDISSILYHVPSGLEHIDKMIVRLGERNRLLSGSKLSGYKDEINVLGISLSILYQVATCHRKCFDGNHVLESLTGRTYNLACSAYTLICRGLYDEALNLIRSMGEISNLIFLFYNDNKALELWLNADKATRLREFRPFKVRELLENHEGPMYADKDWYSKFCEDYTHVHPRTRPNVHNEQSIAYVGGFFQEEGLKYSIGELTTVCAYIAGSADVYE